LSEGTACPMGSRNNGKSGRRVQGGAKSCIFWTNALMIGLCAFPRTLLSCAMNRFNPSFVRRACVFGTALAVTIGAAPRFACADLGGAPTLSAASAHTALKAVTTDVSTATSSSTTAAATATANTATTTTSYTVRTATLASGTEEREYVSVDGVVFGVAWNGPSAPDFKALFGTSAFANYANGLQAASASGGRRGRAGGPVTVTTSGLIVQMGGHQRALYGRAYMPDLLPSGLSASDIQ